jgi:tetratricopeptide (TPR) repeat protein
VSSRAIRTARRFPGRTDFRGWRSTGVILVILFALTVLSAAGSAKGPPGMMKADSIRAAQQAEAERKKLERLDPRAFDLFVNGLLMEYSGDLETAAQLYQRALDYFSQSYEIRLSLASALYNLRRPGEALTALRQMSRMDGPAYGLAAACYRAMGDVENSAQAYLRQVQFDSLSAPAYFFLAGYYRSKNNADSTVWAFHSLERILPENYQVLNDLGRLEAQRGNVDSARAAFGRSVAINHDTTNSRAVVSLAETFEMSNQPDSAAQVLESAVRVSPTFIPYRQSLINVYVRMDSTSRALPHAHFVAEADSADNFSWRRLAILYYGFDSLDKAETILSDRVRKGDREAANFYYLGRIAAAQGKWKDAADQFERMTEVADTSATAWISLAGAQRQLGENEKAIATLRSISDRMPNEKSALDIYYALGSTYERIGNLDSAAAVFEELLKHAPNFAQVMNYLGYMLADNNMRLDYAKDLIARALELEPNNAAYLDSYGWVLFRLGQFDEALKYLLKAAELQSDPTVLEHVGDAYQALKQTADAREWWRKALQIQPENKQVKEKLKD